MPSNWAYIPLSKELKTDIENFKKNIPREWQCDYYGRPLSDGADSNTSTNITFLLNLPARKQEQIIQNLESLLGSTPAFSIRFGELFFSRVDRIREIQGIHCIGIAVGDKDGILRALREKAAKETNGKIPYDGPGHLSLVYILPAFAEEAKKYMMEKKRFFKGKRIVVQHVDAEFWDGNSYRFDLVNQNI